MQLLGLTFILYVSNKIMHIRMLRGPLFQGSFPRAPFPLKLWKGEKGHGGRKGRIETNKQRNKIKNI